MGGGDSGFPERVFYFIKNTTVPGLDGMRKLGQKTSSISSNKGVPP